MDTHHFPADKIRNIGIIAHIDAGKTTTTERMLFYSGLTRKLGSVDDGTTITDWMDQERERGITIVSAAITAQWHAHQINIIDTPGHIDFTAEVQRALRVLDGGVVVFDGVHGVESQSETVWRQADRYAVPRICFINKMDRVGADFSQALDSIRQRLHVEVAPLQLPLGTEKAFNGVIDLLGMQTLTWADELGAKPSRGEIPAPYRAAANAAREQLVELIAETDDTLLERYLNGDTPTVAELVGALRRATLANRLFPVLCGAALRNVGVQPLLDAVVDYLPSPEDLPALVGQHPKTGQEERRAQREDAPLCALVFKTVSDPYAGRLAYVRVYSGRLKSGDQVFNPRRNKKDRIGRLVRIFADRREDIDRIPAGEIDAVLSLKHAFTGDTLCTVEQPILLEAIQFPDPVINIAVEPVSSHDKDELSKALQQLAEEDPTFHAYTDEDSGQTILAGMGELHLEILLNRISREYQVQVRTGVPRISYRETVVMPVQRVEGRYIHQSGGHGQYGHVVIDLQPGEPGSGVQFHDQTKGGVVPHQFIPAVRKGIEEAAGSGLIGGQAITDIDVTLVDGSSHSVDSSEMAFKNAAATALKQAVALAGPILLEPVCKIQVTTPEENLGDVLGQLSARRCLIEGTMARMDGTQDIRGHVPLSEMFGYATDLRSASKGRALFTMEFDHYAPVPEKIMLNLLEQQGIRLPQVPH